MKGSAILLVTTQTLQISYWCGLKGAPRNVWKGGPTALLLRMFEVQEAQQCGGTLIDKSKMERWVCQEDELGGVHGASVLTY